MRRKPIASEDEVNSLRTEAVNSDAREKQLISLAIDLAERQLLDGTASAQVITHYLKLGSSMQKLEFEKLQEENKLLRAKTEALQSAKRAEELYSEALNAIRLYNGYSGSDHE